MGLLLSEPTWTCFKLRLVSGPANCVRRAGACFQLERARIIEEWLSHTSYEEPSQMQLHAKPRLFGRRSTYDLARDKEMYITL
jgi:hypothetical protein